MHSGAGPASLMNDAGLAPGGRYPGIERASPWASPYDPATNAGLFAVRVVE